VYDAAEILGRYEMEIGDHKQDPETKHGSGENDGNLAALACHRYSEQNCFRLSTFFRLGPARFMARVTSPLLLPVFFAS
jgi:hypothetical protein